MSSTDKLSEAYSEAEIAACAIQNMWLAGRGLFNAGVILKSAGVD